MAGKAYRIAGAKSETSSALPTNVVAVVIKGTPYECRVVTIADTGNIGCRHDKVARSLAKAKRENRLLSVRVNEACEDPRGIDCALWEQLPKVSVPLAPVPLEAQPNEYIRTAWAGRRYGLLKEVQATAARFCGRLSVCLEWPGSAERYDEFPDGAGIYFPASGEGCRPMRIGSPADPSRLWLWRDRVAVRGSEPTVRAVLAIGAGAFRPIAAPSTGPAAIDEVTAASADAGGMRRVVISGDERFAGAARMGVVIWQGANEERAGLASVTHEWATLSGEAS